MAAFSDVEHPWSWLHREEIKCSSCPAQVNPFNVWYRHPVLKTIQCSECYKFYNQGMIPEFFKFFPYLLQVNLQKMKMVITCIADCVAKEDRYTVATIASNPFVNNAFCEILVELQSQKLKVETNGNVTFVAQKNSKNREIAPRKFTIGLSLKIFLIFF